jgi:hypothetical protein
MADEYYRTMYNAWYKKAPKGALVF